MEEVKNDSKEEQNIPKQKETNIATNETYKIMNIYESTDLELESNEDGMNGRVKFFKNYLTELEANELYEDLVKDIKWEQKESVNITGDKYPEPRLTFWYGRPYKYSKVDWPENEDWHPKLRDLKVALSTDGELSTDPKRDFNSVMCNYYRDNNDFIGWHADDESSLGRCPRIASISLGTTRVFEVCKKEEYHNRYRKPIYDKSTFAGCTVMYRFHLGNGSLLFMEGSVQDYWLHRVPKESKEMKGRINLTFRYIVDKDEETEEIKYKKKRKIHIQKDLVTNERNSSYKDEEKYFNNGKLGSNKFSDGRYYDKNSMKYDNRRNNRDNSFRPNYYDRRNDYKQRFGYNYDEEYYNAKGYFNDEGYYNVKGYNNDADYYNDEGYYYDNRNNIDEGKRFNERRPYNRKSNDVERINKFVDSNKSKYQKNDSVSRISNNIDNIKKYGETMNDSIQFNVYKNIQEESFNDFEHKENRSYSDKVVIKSKPFVKTDHKETKGNRNCQMYNEYVKGNTEVCKERSSSVDTLEIQAKSDYKKYIENHQRSNYLD